MATTAGIASDIRTMGDPLTGSSTKLIPATRVYIKTAITTPFTEPASGRITATTGPAGWTDLGGILNSKVMITYNKDLKEIRTGLDQILRVSYVSNKTATASFALENYDVAALAAITGQTALLVYSGTPSAYVGQKLFIGKEDVVSKAIMFLCTNKIDNKEHRFFNPSADLSFTFEEDGDSVVIRVTASLNGFVPADDTSGLTSYYTHTVYNAT
jgi:hypothetical protein